MKDSRRDVVKFGTLSVLVLFPVVVQGAPISYDDLSRYLSRNSEGWIEENTSYSAECRRDRSACGRFDRVDKIAGKYWDSHEALPDEVLQKLFVMDEDRFVASEGVRTFAGAKESFYSRLNFHDGKIVYELPFYNLRGWGSLIHPPIRELSGGAGRYLDGLDPMPDRGRGEHVFFNEDFQLRIDQLSQTELTAGNRLELLPGTDAYDAKLAMIKNAKNYLWVQNMVFFCDPESDVLLDAMFERVRAGVEVRIILEGLWMTLAGSPCLQKMKKNGIDLVLVADHVKHGVIGVTHTKYWIRDGVEAIFGGRNLFGSQHTGDGFNEGYRDTDAYVKSGPVVTDMMAAYIETWRDAQTKKSRSIDGYIPMVNARLADERARGVRGLGVYNRFLRDPKLRMNGVCRVLSQGRAAKTHAIAPVLTELAANSSRRILLTTPGLKFSEKLNGNSAEDPFIRELRDAAEKRGARVDLLTNGIDSYGGETTKFTRNFANWLREKGQKGLESAINQLTFGIGTIAELANQKSARNFVNLSLNLHAWQYFRYTHQKVQMFDRILVGIGSFNLDEFSASRNREGDLFCMDQHLLDQAEAAFARDVTNSTPVAR